MRRLTLCVITLIAFGCSSDRSVPTVPVPARIHPSLDDVADCQANAATCDQIYTAADSLQNSSDTVCQNIGNEAMKRFWDPHYELNTFQNGSENFKINPIADEALPAGHAPIVAGTSYIPSGYSNADVLQMVVYNEAQGQGRDADLIAYQCTH